MHYPLANHTKLQHWSLAWLPVHISNTKRKMQLLAWTLNVLVQTFGTKTTPPMHIRLKKKSLHKQQHFSSATCSRCRSTYSAPFAGPGPNVVSKNGIRHAPVLRSVFTIVSIVCTGVCTYVHMYTRAASTAQVKTQFRTQWTMRRDTVVNALLYRLHWMLFGI